MDPELEILLRAVHDGKISGEKRQLAIVAEALAATIEKAKALGYVPPCDLSGPSARDQPAGS